MKSELRLCDHTAIPGAKVVEVWYDGEFVATVTGADGPGVRVISKYLLEAVDLAPVTGVVPRAIQVVIIKTVCVTCKSQPGVARTDNGLLSGVHCDDCWEKLVADARSRGW